MDEFELRQRRIVAEKYRQYREAIQPIIKQKCRILGICIPTLILHSDGHIEHRDDGMSDAAKETMRMLDELLDSTAKQFGFKITEVDGQRVISYVTA